MKKRVNLINNITLGQRDVNNFDEFIYHFGSFILSRVVSRVHFHYDNDDAIIYDIGDANKINKEKFQSTKRN